MMESDLDGHIRYSASILGWTEQEIEAYCEKVQSELRQGQIHCNFSAGCIYAQKPHSSDSSP